jgi:hypothetical protein
MESHIAVRGSVMKLRIKRNSLRFRVTPSEIKQLLRDGAIREHVQLTADPKGRLIYAITSSISEATTTVAYYSGNITVSVPNAQIIYWAYSEEIGVYADVTLGEDRALSVTIEKDFAWLDRSDADNEDTFPNPNLTPPVERSNSCEKVTTVIYNLPVTHQSKANLCQPPKNA